MSGPDLRINSRPMGVGPMGPPILTAGAPVPVPGTPTVPMPAPTSSPATTAARQIDYNSLRSFAQPSNHIQGCRGCGPDGPQLADIAPPSLLGNVPKWALVLGGLTGLGLVIGLVAWLSRR